MVSTPGRPDRAARTRRVVLDIAIGHTGGALHGTAQIAEWSQPQAFWGVMDLLRILELASETAHHEPPDPSAGEGSGI